MLNIPCIFSIHVSSLFICNYILFSTFWIIFAIIILNYFWGRLPISSFVWFGRFLSCSSTCWVFLRLFILFRLLIGVPFLQAGGSWLLLIVLSAPCGWDWTSGLSRFPGWGTCVCVLVEGGGSLLSEVQLSVQYTPVLLPGKSHGRRSLVGCSARGCWESDTTEWLHFHFSLSCIGEGNGNPLQCPCLENPRDGGTWWAAVYGVAQSRTWLKWLSSSNSKFCDVYGFGMALGSLTPNIQGWVPVLLEN